MKRLSDLLTGGICAAALMLAVAGGLLLWQKWNAPTTVGQTIHTQLDPSRPTVVLISSKNCHYCQESAPFYLKLSTAKINFVLMTENELAPAYRIDQIIQVKKTADLPKGFVGTPTLMVLDAHGKVVKEYVGKLSESKEAEVLKRYTN